MPGYANPQALNRYSYVLGNPLRYTDPTGHMLDDGCRDYGCGNTTPPPPVNLPTPQPDPDPEPDDNFDLLNSHNNNETTTLPLLDGTLYFFTGSGQPFPPSPFACGWVDCALSGVSVIASALTLSGLPEIAVPAFVVDVVVTTIAVDHTNKDYEQGRISKTRQWAINGTGILGLVPSNFGLGLSIVNFALTTFGIIP